MQSGNKWENWLFWRIKFTFSIKCDLLQLHLAHSLLMVEAEGFFSLSFGIKPITFLLRYTSANHYATKGKKMAFQGTTGRCGRWLSFSTYCKSSCTWTKGDVISQDRHGSLKWETIYSSKRNQTVRALWIYTHLHSAKPFVEEFSLHRSTFKSCKYLTMKKKGFSVKWMSKVPRAYCSHRQWPKRLENDTSHHIHTVWTKQQQLRKVRPFRWPPWAREEVRVYKAQSQALK